MNIVPISNGAGQASPFDQIKRTDETGSEFWSARDLMPLLGYEKWERFSDSIQRAEAVAANQGVQESFSRRRETASGGGRPREDVIMSRYGAYLVAMNGDPRKLEVAAAQSYFAIRTREAEVARPKTQDEIVAEAMQIMSGRVQALEAKVQEDAPKVGYVDNFVADDDRMLLRRVSTDLNVGESDLRELLIYTGWIYKEEATRRNSKGEKVKQTRYSPYATKQSYFHLRMNHEAPFFKGTLMHTLMVTPPGAEAIARLVDRTATEHGSLKAALPVLRAAYEERKRQAVTA